MPHGTVFGFNTRKKYSVLLLTPPCDKIPTNQVNQSRPPYKDDPVSKSILGICKNTKNSMLVNLLGCMHKLVEKMHSINDI